MVCTYPDVEDRDPSQQSDMPDEPLRHAHRSSLEAFESIRSASQCLFASTSRLLGCPVASPGASAAQLVALLAPAMAELCAQPQPYRIEGVVAEITEHERGATLGRLARTVYEVLFGLAGRDKDARACLEEPIGAPDWWFRFAGVELLLVTFAPCYGPSHPRCSFGPSTFLLFQPHAVFARRRPAGSENFPVGTKQAIRRAFEHAGRPYDAQLSASAVESHKFVKPLRVGDPPVEWWREQAWLDAPPSGAT